MQLASTFQTATIHTGIFHTGIFHTRIGLASNREGLFTRALGLFIVTSCICALSACAVTSVDPVVPSRSISMLCIDHNPAAGENYDSEISEKLATMGIKSRMTGGAFPGECPHRLQTSVAWSDTLIKYVLSLDLVITEDNRPLGDAHYRVGQAYRTPERLGSAASKAKPLLDELLAEYDNPSTSGLTSSEPNRPD